MTTQFRSGLLLVFMFMMTTAYAADDKMVAPELENAMKSCRESAKGSVEVFNQCMEQKGVNNDSAPVIPEPTKEIDTKLQSAIRDCHKTMKDNLAGFESCMEGKGFNRPGIDMSE
ncbi:hypothetical protein [Methylophaga sulfidovorans]|uniref:Cysteine rich repeat-containing protein n=1 Tax=Methylophaga sulfidovorans TaxID=45496 RepID=A0A1I3ZXR3_9GAMM|nr:hypothetical protein [Methylophaga sulfidovorans]SFK48677.1 hypothetical protein SAMN04488079_11268 [Methylophaga sulfidovorans]